MPCAKYYRTHKAKCKESSAQWYRDHPEVKITQNNRRLMREPQLREIKKTLSRNYNRNIRLKVLSHYSGGTPSCACCGEIEIIFLCIDHINGGGNRQRRSITKSLSHWLYKQGYPVGYRILCWNCNAAIGIKGDCPHKIKEQMMEVI